MLQVARVLKSNGTEGELLIGLTNVSAGDIDLTEPVFIECDGLPVPFFIESLVPRGTSRALVRLTGVHNLTDADELAGSPIYLDAPDEDADPLDNLEGWTVLSQVGVKVGTVSGYEPIPGNPCIYVDTEKGQAMLPLREELVLSIDEDSRTVVMVIPDGLLEI